MDADNYYLSPAEFAAATGNRPAPPPGTPSATDRFGLLPLVFPDGVPPNKSGLGRDTAAHPTTIRAVLDEVRESHPRATAVITSLVWRVDLADLRAHYMGEEFLAATEQAGAAALALAAAERDAKAWRERAEVPDANPVVRVACVIALRGDSVLLMRHVKGACAGKWVLPGGKVEAGEDWAAAAYREMREETGIDVVFFGPAFAMPSRREGYDFRWLVCRPRGEPVNSEPAKCDWMDWFPLDALPEPMHEPDREALAAWQRVAGPGRVTREGE